MIVSACAAERPEGRENPDSHARWVAGGGRSGEYLVEFEPRVWEGAADAAVE
jgi:hypothetical protein